MGPVEGPCIKTGTKRNHLVRFQIGQNLVDRFDPNEGPSIDYGILLAAGGMATDEMSDVAVF